jgi:predicted phosphodiesterase
VNFRRWFTIRRTLALSTLLVGLAVFTGYAWSRVTPTIGEPEKLAPQGDKLWSFGFVGDTQLDGEIAERIFDRMGDEHVEFALHLGDLVDDADNQSQWDDLLHRAARHRIRIMPVVGNHDRLPDYNDHGEIRFRQYFPALPDTFYHFRHRGINFLMLNSERSLAAGSEQARFLKWQLEHHPGTAIVCLHRPVFTSGDRDWVQQMARRFWLHPGLRGSDTVAVLAGHNHYYDRTRPLDGITYVVSGGGSSNLYPAAPPKPITAASKSKRNHFGLVEVYANCLQVRVVDLEGQDLDRFCLPLKPSTHPLGSFHNPLATELPPLDTLDDYRPHRLEVFTATHGTLPRPW